MASEDMDTNSDHESDFNSSDRVVLDEVRLGLRDTRTIKLFLLLKE